MNKNTKLFAGPVIVLLASASITVGSTYALFTSNDEATVKVTSGNVELSNEVNQASLAVYSASVTQTEVQGDAIAGTKEIDATDVRWEAAANAGVKAYQSTYYYELQDEAYSGDDGTGFYFANDGYAAINADHDYVVLSNMSSGDRVTFTMDVKNESSIDIKYRLRFALNEDEALYDDTHTLADAKLFANALKYSWGDKSYSKWHQWDSESVVKTKTLWFDFELPILVGNAYQDKLAYFTFIVEAVQANAYTADPADPMEIDVEKTKTGEDTTLETPTASVTVPADTVANGTELHLEVEHDVAGGFTFQTPVAGTTDSFDVIIVDENGTPISELKLDPDVIFNCKIYLGVVDLYKFYHLGDELTLVSSKADIDLTHAYYCLDLESDDLGYIFFKTKSFSPFTATYEFAGGINIEEYPYLISTVAQFKRINNICSANYTTKKSWFKLINNVTIEANNCTTYISGKYFAVANGLNVDIDGDGYMLTIKSTATKYPYLFYQVQDFKLHDCDITINDQTLIMNTYLNTAFENINIYGYLNVGNNSAAFITYCQRDASFTKCNSYVNIKGYGIAGSYNAIYVGYTFGTTITFDDCHNKGTIVSGKAVMFVGNVHNSYSAKLVIKDCSNDGLIQWLDKDSSQGAYGYYNQFVAGSGQCLGSVTLDGCEYTNADDIKALQIPTTGSGLNTWGPQDTTLAIAETEDGTLEVTGATVEGAVRYEVVINTYAGVDEGGSRQVAVFFSFTQEDLVDNKFNTGLKVLNFVDQYWVADHPEAVKGTLAGKTIYTLNDVSYFYMPMVGARFSSGVGSVTSVYVACYDANDTPLATARILPTA